MVLVKKKVGFIIVNHWLTVLTHSNNVARFDYLVINHVLTQGARF